VLLGQILLMNFAITVQLPILPSLRHSVNVYAVDCQKLSRHFCNHVGSLSDKRE